VAWPQSDAVKRKESKPVSTGDYKGKIKGKPEDFARLKDDKTLIKKQKKGRGYDYRRPDLPY